MLAFGRRSSKQPTLLSTFKRHFRAQKDAPVNAFTDTLCLPTTNFPIRAEAFKNEPPQVDLCCDKIYAWQRRHMKGQPEYVLHDGPPFANGSLHMGHLLNKVLKDITNRYKLLRGHHISFTPGWDCHGLPIELKALEALRMKGGMDTAKLSAMQIRDLAQGFALAAIEGQKKDFRRWGVMGDWSSPYMTMLPEYEAEQLEVFLTMFSRGLIYRARKPVFWSPASQTALAEAELEYVDTHESPSVYVAFPLSKVTPEAAAVGLKPGMSCVTWTTTPWTLPANQAICYLPSLSYVIVERPERSYLIATQSFDRICEMLNWDNSIDACTQFSGELLKDCVCTHPFLPQPAPLLAGDHVSGESGTGLVHTAPSHGLDDFYVCQSAGITLCEPRVDEKGRFTEAAGEFVGKYVFTAGNDAVIQKLRDENTLLHLHKYRHQYPYDWRSKTPVIFRATEQWFCVLDKLQQEAVDALKEVKIVPPVGRNRFEADLKNRQEWCLSRQRHWGVPIPAFYDENGNVLMTRTSINHVKELVRKHGVGCWWTMKTEELLAPEYQQDGHTYTRGTDTMDVWFDSGSSWKSALQPRGVSSPVDLYLEGSDQYRGWFQSSLLTSVATNGIAPYRNLLTHGFVLDEKGHKMSKSLGNVLEPSFFINGTAPTTTKKATPADAAKKNDKKPVAFGADVLRLWATSRDFTSDVTIGTEIVERVSDTLRKYRGVCRFLLGCLGDFTVKDRVEFNKLRKLDKYALIKIKQLRRDITQSYDKFDYHRVFQTMNVAVRDLCSAFYLDLVKDRLYCDEKAGLSRRSVQTVAAVILETLVKGWAPIVCFTAEEVFRHVSSSELLAPHTAATAELQSVFTQGWLATPEEWQDEQLEKHFTVAIAVRGEFLRLMDLAKRGEVKDLKLGTSMEARVVLTVTHQSAAATALRALADELEALFMVAEVTLDEVPSAPASPSSSSSSPPEPSVSGRVLVGEDTVLVEVLHAKGTKCERCWRHAPCTNSLCPRCTRVLGK